MNRRSFLKLVGQAFLATAASATYAIAIEPHWLRVVHRPIWHPSVPNGLTLKIAMIADLHACYPWMPPERIAQIVETTNALSPDLTVLTGDYVTGHRFTSAQVPPSLWAGALGRLTAPLGVHAVLGNHDWWDDAQAMRTGEGPPLAQRALEQAGIQVLENDALRLEKSGHPFWLAGLGDQLAFHPWSRAGAGQWRGRVSKCHVLS